MDNDSKDSGLEDLREFIRIGNRSLLIKGKSGTGKVTLAFELAKDHLDRFDVIFISRRATEQSLYRRFPWIKNFVKQSNIISVSGTDIMLDDPSFIITNVISSIMNLTPTVKDPFVSLDEHVRPFVILDVWDAITKEVDAPTRIRAEKLLTSMTEKHIGFLVFLTEETENQTIEYLVDGVTLLTQNFYKSYRLREMYIEKLRGVAISRSKVPFTLDGGRFRVFSKLSHELPKPPKNFIAMSNNERFYSTGNPDLDKRLNGGFKRGSVVSVEIEEDVDRFVFVPVMLPLVLNFISQGNPAFLISAADQDVSAVTRHLIPHIDESMLNKFFRIFATNIEESAYVVSLEGKSFNDDYNTWVETYKKLREGAKGSLMFIDFSFLELKHQNAIESIRKRIVDLARLVRTSNDLFVMISRPSFKTLEVMKSVSDVHLRIFEYDGATMLAAVKPQLFLCNIQTETSKGFPRAMLLDSL